MAAMCRVVLSGITDSSGIRHLSLALSTQSRFISLSKQNLIHIFRDNDVGFRKLRVLEFAFDEGGIIRHCGLIVQFSRAVSIVLERLIM